MIATRGKSGLAGNVKEENYLQVLEGVNERKTNPEHTKFTRTSTIRHIYVRIGLLYALMVVDAPFPLPLKRRKLTSIDSMEAETAKVFVFFLSFFFFFFFSKNFTICKIFLIFNLCTCSNLCFCYWVDLGFV